MHKLITSIMWGSAFIFVGFVWLLDSLGIVRVDIGKWWPLIFVFIGINIIVDGIVKATGRSTDRD